MVSVCPLCKKVLVEGEDCGCTSSRLDPKQREQRSKAGRVLVGMTSSTAFFVITVFYTMSVFFSALSSGTSFYGIYGGMMGTPSGVSALADGNILPHTILLLLSVAPAMMICAGMWILVFESRKPGGGAQVGALTFIKGAAIAQFSMIFILIAFVETALFLSFTFIKNEPFAWSKPVIGGMSNLILGITMLTTAALAFVMAIYLKGIMKTVRMAVSTLRAGERWGEIPLTLIVINTTLAVIALIGAGFDISRGNAAAAVSAIFSAAFLIGISASLSVVRKSL